MAGSFLPYQLIDKEANQVAPSLSSLFHYLVPSAEFLTMALVGCLICWIVSWLFSRFKRQTRSLPTRRTKRNLPKKIVAFGFLMFLFYLKQFFEMSLNTSILLVDIENLLYSREQILRTDKEFCFLEKGAEENFLKSVS